MTPKSSSITKNRVVQYHYRMLDGADVIESSEEDGPEVYLHGYGQLLPALEDALEGQAVPGALRCVLPPERAFGLRRDGTEHRVDRGDLPDELEINDQIVAVDEDDVETELWVVKVEGDKVVLTENHPLAGKTITFEVQLEAVRDALSHEIEDETAWGWSGDETPEEELEDEWDVMMESDEE